MPHRGNPVGSGSEWLFLPILSNDLSLSPVTGTATAEN
jgi:hypothetical protein